MTPCEFTLLPVRDCLWGADSPVITGTADVVNYFHACMAQAPGYEPHLESLFVVLLGGGRELLGHYLVAKGNFNQVYFGLSQLLLPCITAAASAFVVVHNHPSGLIEPSLADIAASAKIRLGADLMSIRYDDFLIVGPPASNGHADYYSFREAGRLEKLDVDALNSQAAPKPPSLIDALLESPDLVVAARKAAAAEGVELEPYLRGFLFKALSLHLNPVAAAVKPVEEVAL